MKEKTSRLHKIVPTYLVLLSLTCIMLIQANAQGIPIEAEILPSQGNANTNILIRFSTKNASIGNVDKVDIFWDDASIALNRQGVQGADGSYNYNLTVPSMHPLSDIGNHTIRVDSSVFNLGPVTFNFTFTITEFVPSPEYLALNATYYDLLANYSTLVDSYSQLLANYSRTSQDYAALLANHSQLLLDYNSLSANYNSLTANYNSLSANYNSLLTNYNAFYQAFSSLQTNYTRLQGSLESLSASYNASRQDYDSLTASYNDLKTDYNAALSQLALSTDLNYIFIASTIILAVATAYLAIKRQKSTSGTR